MRPWIQKKDKSSCQLPDNMERYWNFRFCQLMLPQLFKFIQTTRAANIRFQSQNMSAKQSRHICRTFPDRESFSFR